MLEIADIGPVDELCKKNKVHRLYIFGSAITDKFTDRSDIDFYVEFWEYNNRSLPLLKKDLQKLFNRRVDLHLKKMKQANFKLIYNSESGGFEKIPTFVETEIDMKITILSYMDFCGSGNKLYRALKPHYDVEIWVGRHNNTFGHPVKQMYTGHKHRIIQQRIDESDVVILKGDFPRWVYEQSWKLKFRCPTFTMPTGTFFRKKEHGGIEQFRIPEYKGYKVSSDTGLLYPEFSDTWTPMPIDSMKEPMLWKQGNILSHSPTDQVKKNTEFIFRVFDGVMKTCNVEIDLIKGVPFAEAVERRKRSTIFFDQFKVGFYGNSALEAMQWGRPTACYLRPSPHLKDCPIINYPLDVNVWVKNICRLLDSDMTELSQKTKQWCDDYHSFEAVAKRWTEILKDI